jgi:molybdopterin-guanine dinucleotide biosynthesis protein A|tara:strand:+ start:51892 stop:52455 length:564 start_codon:yes stop_codon:yes gene_type:complete
LGSLLLAGGMSSRMGIDKALIEINGKSCISRVVSSLHLAGLAPIIISISDIILIKKYQRLLDPSIEVKWVVDTKKYAGPIESIIENLENIGSKYEYIQLATVDVPWITEHFFKNLKHLIRDGDDLIIPTDGERMHPLLSLIKPQKILKKLADGDRRPLNIQFSELKHSTFFENKDILKNINNPHDLI